METIGDAYMAVGGAPVKDVLHAERTCDMAMDMVDAIQDLTDPSTGRHPSAISFFAFHIALICLDNHSSSLFRCIIT